MRRNPWIRIILIIAASALMCIIAPVSVELSFSSVPVTAGTFAVPLIAVILGWRDGLIAILIYVLLGAFGLPVFAGWNGGFSWLFGNTGGYIFGYFVMVLIAGLIVDRHQFRLFSCLLAVLAASLVELALGNLWLSAFSSTLSEESATFSQAAVYGVVPFLLFDLVKALAAWLIGYFMRTRIKVFIKPQRTK